MGDRFLKIDQHLWLNYGQESDSSFLHGRQIKAVLF